MNRENVVEFSSPFRGFYLSTEVKPYVGRFGSSRPLFGVSIFLHIER